MSVRQYSKKYGEAWVYSPIPCFTGALHAQPSTTDIRLDTCTGFANGYDVFFDMRGALDAPNLIPRGGVRAQDFESGGRILVGHVYRDRWHA